jgi:hypothetical protein
LEQTENCVKRRNEPESSAGRRGHCQNRGARRGELAPQGAGRAARVDAAGFRPEKRQKGGLDHSRHVFDPSFG